MCMIDDNWSQYFRYPNVLVQELLPLFSCI